MTTSWKHYLERSDYKSGTVISHGFTDEKVIQNFPLRGKPVYLHVRRRRWYGKATGIMRKQILSLLVVLLIGSTVCMAQDRQKGKVDREKRIEQIITDLGLNEKQAKDFKAAMEEMRPTKRNSNERPSREEMQKKRKEGEAKIKSILTDEQYKKYQDMRKKENADRKKRTK